jgi:hypothetical protein
MLGRAAIPKYALITSLDGVPTPDLHSFALVLRSLQHAARVPLEYITFGERHRRKSAILQVGCAASACSGFNGSRVGCVTFWGEAVAQERHPAGTLRFTFEWIDAWLAAGCGRQPWSTALQW